VKPSTSLKSQEKRDVEGRFFTTSRRGGKKGQNVLDGDVGQASHSSKRKRGKKEGGGLMRQFQGVRNREVGEKV